VTVVREERGDNATDDRVPTFDLIDVTFTESVIARVIAVTDGESRVFT